jgi:cytochrome P450
MKREIFKPIFMNFPILDHFPFPSRVYARSLVSKFSSTLQSALAHPPSTEVVSEGQGNPDGLGARLFAAQAVGLLTLKQYRDNLNVLFVASQENPQIALISCLYLLAKHLSVQETLQAELVSRSEDTPLETLPFLTATILECLRLYPPISQLINRLTTAPASLSSSGTHERVMIPAGTYVGYHAYSTNRDIGIWGADSDKFRPERWGKSLEEIHATHRRVRAKGGFITFHGGRRACLGERFAMIELRVGLAGLLQAFALRPSDSPVKMMPVSNAKHQFSPSLNRTLEAKLRLAVVRLSRQGHCILVDSRSNSLQEMPRHVSSIRARIREAYSLQWKINATGERLS